MRWCSQDGSDIRVLDAEMMKVVHELDKRYGDLYDALVDKVFTSITPLHNQTPASKERFLEQVKFHLHNAQELLKEGHEV